MAYKRGSNFVVADIAALHKELDETSCPICMDHPHNAVLLICSSHEKGCRSYICDTSYRHSNCLDRFKKLRMNDNENSFEPRTFAETSHAGNAGLDTTYHVNSQPNAQTMRNLIQINEEPIFLENSGGVSSTLIERFVENNQNQVPQASMAAAGEEMTARLVSGSHSSFESNGLKCPLCRGAVVGWIIVKEVREYLDQKPRSCSRESCSFSGNYKELRRHARRIHPSTRPADVDPTRQRAWRRLQHQREYGDILSAIRSTMPGAVVMGDYVLDNGDGLLRDRESYGSGESTGSWLPTFFLLHMIGSPARTLDERRSSSRAWRTHRRSGHRNLWGENLSGMQNNNDGNLDDGIPIPRRRRRFMRSRPDEEQL